MWYINVRDVAAVHLGALILQSPPNARLFTVAGAFNTNMLLAAFRALTPGWDKLEDVSDGSMGEEKTVWDRAASEEVLRKMGSKGWRTLEETLRENVL